MLDRLRLSLHHFCMSWMGRLFLPVGGLLLAAFLIAGQIRESKSGSELAAPTTAASVTPPIAAEEFMTWVSAEAQKMNLAKSEHSDKQNQLISAAQKLNLEQRRQLLKLARDPKASTPEKVLSTYMLVEAGPAGFSELRALISSPVHDRDPIGSQRDKTLRIMALDGLSSRAMLDPGAQEALVRVLEDIQDPDVKSYARQKMQQVQVR